MIAALLLGLVVVQAMAPATRRGFLAQSGASLVVATTEPPALTSEVSLKSGRVMMPSAWKQTPGGLVDPVLGDITTKLDVTTRPVDATSIADLGKIDNFPLVDLGIGERLAAADVVAARRRDDGERLFYEWDLAVSPDTCPREQRLVVTTCLPDEVALVSATVENGTLVVFGLVASPSQWRNFGKNLRDLRSSFAL